jgi:hypothetical protein
MTKREDEKQLRRGFRMTEREVVLVVQPIERMRLLENAVRPRERERESALLYDREKGFSLT